MFQNSRTLDLLLERFQCTRLGSKLIFWVFSHHFGALKCPLCFAPHTLHPKLMFLGGFTPFIRCTRPIAETGSRVHGQVGAGCAAVSGIPAACLVSKTSGVLASVQQQR